MTPEQDAKFREALAQIKANFPSQLPGKLCAEVREMTGATEAELVLAFALWQQSKDQMMRAAYAVSAMGQGQQTADWVKVLYGANYFQKLFLEWYLIPHKGRPSN